MKVIDGMSGRRIVTHASGINVKYAALSQTKAKALTEAEEDRLGPLGWTIATEAQCLNDCLLDLGNALEKEGLFRHGVKRALHQSMLMAEKVSTECYKVLYKTDIEVARDYLGFYEMMASKIDESVYLAGSERCLSIAMALCREMLRNNDELWEFGLGIPIVEDKIYQWRVQHIPAVLSQIKKIISETKLEDKGLDAIIRSVFSEGNTLCFVTKQEKEIKEALQRKAKIERIKARQNK